MGMSASQVRFLSITNRAGNVDYAIQKLAQEKLSNLIKSPDQISAEKEAVDKNQDAINCEISQEAVDASNKADEANLEETQKVMDDNIDRSFAVFASESEDSGDAQRNVNINLSRMAARRAY